MNTSSRPYYSIVLDLVPDSHEKACHMTQLADILSISTREVRQAIHDARHDGISVLSDDTGYWISDNDTEISKFCIINRNRANKVLEYIDEIEKKRTNIVR